MTTGELPGSDRRAIERARSVIAALGMPDPDDAVRVALVAAGGEHWRAHRGLALALRRAERVQRKPAGGDWFRGPDWRLDVFVARCVHDADRLDALRTEVLRHVGWAPNDREAYMEALRYAMDVLVVVAGYANKAIAQDALHDAVVRAAKHFASATDVDVAQPRAYARCIIRHAVHDQFRPRAKVRVVTTKEGLDHVAETMVPGPELVALSEPVAPHFRMGLTRLLFDGVITALTAALALGFVATSAEGARIEEWPWADPPMPSPAGSDDDRLKYMLLRKSNPGGFTPHVHFNDKQRQNAKTGMFKAAAALRQLWWGFHGAPE